MRIQEIPIIDAHLHLWDTTKMDYPWLEDEISIKRDFLMEDYQQQTVNFSIQKMVFVQCECKAEQYLDELAFVSNQALTDPRLKGIVAYAAIEQGKDIKKVLETFQSNPLIKGVRRMYDTSPELCVDADFLDAVRLLPSYNLSCDISIKPASVEQTLKMIRLCPDTQFVLAHLAKPDIRNGSLTEFKKNMDAFASLPNVVAKISGLITEADREEWTTADIRPYIDYAIDSFGFDRLMYGGDWPVVLLAGTYPQWLSSLFTCVESCSDTELNKLFYDTANSVYRL
jgi:L-fuconolactonase